MMADFGEQATVALEWIEADPAARETTMLVLYDDDGYVVDWQIESDDSTLVVLPPNDVPW